MRKKILAGAILLALAGCAAHPASVAASPTRAQSQTAAESPTAQPDPIAADQCGKAAVATEVLTVGDVRVAVLGTGSATLVLSNQSDESLCAWLPFTSRLGASGYRIALWDYGSTSPVDELGAVVAALHSNTVILGGASKGAKTSLIAATKISPPVAGVVSLSAESSMVPGIDVVAAVRPLRVPVLLATAADDPYGSAQAAPQIEHAMAGKDKTIVTVPGSAHGTALLPAVLPQVTAFLQRVCACKA